MRKFIEIITEARRGFAPIGELRARVFWNPLAKDLRNMLERSKLGDVRGSFIKTSSGNMIAIWPARSLGHWNFHNECYAREGIVATETIDLRIVRDLQVLSEERYWQSAKHFEGDGFYCAFFPETDLPPELTALLGPISEVEY